MYSVYTQSNELKHTRSWLLYNGKYSKMNTCHRCRKICCDQIMHRCRFCSNWLTRVLIRFILYTRSPTSWIIPEVDLCLQRKVCEHAHVIQVRQFRCYSIVHKCRACSNWLTRNIIRFILYTRSPASWNIPEVGLSITESMRKVCENAHMSQVRTNLLRSNYAQV